MLRMPAVVVLFGCLLGTVQTGSADPPPGTGRDLAPGQDLRVQRALESRRGLDVQADSQIRSAGDHASSHSSANTQARSAETARELRSIDRLQGTSEIQKRIEHARHANHPPGQAARSRTGNDSSLGMRSRGKETAPGQLVKQGISRADALLALRLASIDHLRDVAADNENADLLKRADALEALARRQYEQRTGHSKPARTPGRSADQDEQRLDAAIRGELQRVEGKSPLPIRPRSQLGR